MNHQPFEDWLLEDARLTTQQDRELQSHLRNCVACSAIAASNVALRAGRLAMPALGFSDRFRPRLTAWRKRQIRRQAIGTVVLVLAGLTLSYAAAGPIMLEAVRSPAAFVRDVTAQVVAVMALYGVAGEVARALLRSLAGVMPPGMRWAVTIIGGAAGFLWIATMRRLARAPRGV